MQTMRDRLIELLEQIAGQTDDDACRDCDGDCVRCAYENVADHLLANGVIVPPCKVGDVVYIPVNGTDTVLQTKVFAIGVDEDGVSVINPKDYPEGVFGVRGCVFGKTVFLTKEEAEQALKEREQDGC